MTRPDSDEIDELFRRYASAPTRRLRAELVEAHMGFAHHLANRYSNRGISDDDLRQTALLALVKAVDRFDPDVGAAFTSFAGRTIEGEIKRHFRDFAWSVRVPRSTKENHLRVRRARDELGQRLGRSPSAREVAAHTGLSSDEVVQALAASAAFASTSLDPRPAEGVAGDRSDRLVDHDEHLEASADRVLVEQMMLELPDREREIVRLRFFEDLTQSEIADRVGVSQMHVSRLLRRALTLMRQHAERDVG